MNATAPSTRSIPGTRARRLASVLLMTVSTSLLAQVGRLGAQTDEGPGASQEQKRLTAVIGGVGGLVIGATYGALISDVTCAESSCTTLGLAAAVGGIGAAGGAAVGALVGLAVPSWKLRFP
ncbi:MAG: hypothetical protein P8Y10_13080 [Gemmatimonadales bacterium]